MISDSPEAVSGKTPAKLAKSSTRSYEYERVELFYNKKRTNSSLKNQIPITRLPEVAGLIPSKASLQAAFDPAKSGFVLPDPVQAQAVEKPLAERR